MRRVLANGASLLTSDVVNRGTTFVLYALVARHFGAFEFGQLSLALALFYTFQVVAAAGMKTLVVREVARNRARTGEYLVNGGVLVVLACLASIGMLFLFVRLMGYAAETASVILLLSLGLLPAALAALLEAVFQAWEKMHLVAWANVPANTAKAGLAFLVLSEGLGLHGVILLILLTHGAVAVIEWRLLRRYIAAPRGRLDPRASVSIARAASTFMGIDVTIAVSTSLLIVLLSGLAGETEVGLFNAAAQLLIPVSLVFESVTRSLFPVMCRRFDPGCRNLKPVAERTLGFLMALALPIAAALFVLADPVLLVLYEDAEFLTAAVVLRILAGTVVLRAVTHALGQVLLASRRERVTLRIVAINTAAGLVLGLALIGRYGLVGAALAALATGLINALQHYRPVSRLLGGISLVGAAWRPALASAAMSAVLVATRGWGLVPSAAAGSAVYAAGMLALAVRAAGGPVGFRARYSFLWSGR